MYQAYAACNCDADADVAEATATATAEGQNADECRQNKLGAGLTISTTKEQAQAFARDLERQNNVRLELTRGQSVPGGNYGARASS